MEMLEKICFVIGPSEKNGFAAGNNSEAVFQHIIKPAAIQCGYGVIHSLDISKAGKISPQVIRRLIYDAFLISDLSGSDPIIYYELAVRHMIQKPFIQITRKGEDHPFDKNAIQSLEIQTFDREQMEHSRRELVQRIRIVENIPPHKIESPLFSAFKLQTVEENPFVDQTVMENSMAALCDLREDLIAQWREEASFEENRL
ncbi:MAG: hypothetical protein ACP5I1_07220 [Candidatus Hinthialibacter sp.]